MSETNVPDLDEVVLCFQWILLAKKKLSVNELYWVIRVSLTDDIGTVNDALELVDEETMERYILDTSRGLVALTPKRGVQFIDDSVKDFVRTEGLELLMKQHGDAASIGASHECLKSCCLSIAAAQKKTTGEETDSSDLQEGAKHKLRLSLIRRAAEEVLYHADRAQGFGVSQSEFLASFDVDHWARLCTMLERHGHITSFGRIRKIVEGAQAAATSIPLDLICAVLDLPQLYQELWKSAVARHGVLDTIQRQWGGNLVSHLDFVSDEMFEILLRLRIESLGMLDALPAVQQLSEQLIDAKKEAQARRSARKGIVGNAAGDMPAKADSGEITVRLRQMHLELERSYCFHVIRCHPDSTLFAGSLRSLLEGGYTTALRLALRCGGISGTEGDGNLLWCQLENDWVFLRQLRAWGVSPEDNNDAGRTALMETAWHNRIPVIELLLGDEAVRASIDCPDTRGQTALHLAVSALSGKHLPLPPDLTVVGLLVDQGASLDVRDHEGQTPLTLAIKHGQVDAEEYLLLKGVKVEDDFRLVDD